MPLHGAIEKDDSYNGDRILVNKFAYEIGEPQRWDVIVFKYPGDPPTTPLRSRTDSRTNYIKRLVGLPGDTIRIQNGDVWVKTAKDKKEQGDAADFVIARKPPRKLLAMLQPVFDNDYMPRIAKYGWPARWYRRPDLPARRPSCRRLGAPTIRRRSPSTGRPRASSGCDTITECRRLSAVAGRRGADGARCHARN